MPTLRHAIALAITVSLAVTARAQRLDAVSSRFALGQRLRAMERELARNPDEAAIRRVRAPLESAVGSFFRGDYGAVGESLVRARFLLEAGREPTPRERSAASLCLVPSRRLLSSTDAQPFEVQPLEVLRLDLDAIALFAVDDAPGLRATLELVPRAEDGEPIPLGTPIPLERLPASRSLTLPRLPVGEYGLRARVGDGEWAWTTEPVPLSVVADVDARIERLEEALRTSRQTDAPADPSTAATLDHVLRLLRRMRAGGDETHHPGGLLMAQAEAMAEALAAGRPAFGPAMHGDLRVRLDTEAGQVVGRLAVPEGLDPEKPTALVIGLHGAGGTENMMFDVHGDGLGPRMALDRGWLFLAPRTATRPGALVAAIDELARHYPIDPRQVFAFGHSMGAGATATLFQSAPDRFAAIAMVAGGGAIRDRAALANAPLLVVVGEADFLRQGVLSFVRAVQRSAPNRLRLIDMADVEHFAVVQLAMPDVFAHFDAAVPR